jgi:hypothetical protein
MDLPRCKICGERHRLGFCPGLEDLPVVCKICGNRHGGPCPQVNAEVSSALLARQRKATPETVTRGAPPATPYIESVKPPRVSRHTLGRPKGDARWKTLEAQAPWKAEGVSRRTWYRKQRK